jgi:RND family efflux transporter MFP subunit
MDARKVKSIVLILLMLFLIAGCGSQQNQEEASAETAATAVEVKTVEPQNFTITAKYLGRVVAAKDVNVLPKVPGKVAQLNVAVGDYVKKGELIAKISSPELENQLKQAQASHNLALTNLQALEESYNDMKFLYENDVIPKNQFDQVKAQYEAAKAQVEQASVAVNSIKTQLNETNIYSPLSGTVVAVNAEVGELAGSTMPLTVIAQMSPPTVEINLVEADLPYVVLGKKTEVKFDAFPDKTFTGTINSISPAINTTTMGYPVKITLNSAPDSLKLGMTANVNLVIDERTGVIVLPMEAVLVRDGKNVVFIAEENKAKMVEVQTGINNGTEVIIEEGLTAGQKVIVRGQYFLNDEAEINIFEEDNR